MTNQPRVYNKPFKVPHHSRPPLLVGDLYLDRVTLLQQHQSWLFDEFFYFRKELSSDRAINDTMIT